MIVIQTIVSYIAEWPYLMKASLILCLLYIPYHYFFCRDTTFIANRIYLLSIMVLTCFVPLIRIDVFPVWVTMTTNGPTMTTDIPTGGFGLNVILKTSFIVVYTAGVIWFLFHMILNVNRLIMTKNGAVKVYKKNHVLVIGTQFPVSSFFNYIFLPIDSVDQMLIKHEMIHVEQRHSVDILLTEFFKCIFWFHPLAYKLRQAISLNHEYECDDSMSKIYSYEQYGNLLFLHAKSNTSNHFINHFYSFTKKRIAMMSQQKNNPTQSHRYLLMIPALLSVFVFFSFRTYYLPAQNPNLTSLEQDTIPKKESDMMDTIITLNPVNYAETVSIVKRQPSEPLDEEEVLRLYPEIISISDTSITLDPKTYEETLVISTTKMKKGYFMLIKAERQKTNPNFELIEKWVREGSKNK